MGPVETAKPPRVAYAIGRKVSTAPGRNRLRRRLRALLAAEQDRLVPATYLVSARPGAADLTFAQLRTDLVGALASLHALPAERDAIATGAAALGAGPHG
jgi:ribonuclease P protein component